MKKKPIFTKHTRVIYSHRGTGLTFNTEKECIEYEERVQKKIKEDREKKEKEAKEKEKRIKGIKALEQKIRTTRLEIKKERSVRMKHLEDRKNYVSKEIKDTSNIVSGYKTQINKLYLAVKICESGMKNQRKELEKKFSSEIQPYNIRRMANMENSIISMYNKIHKLRYRY